MGRPQILLSTLILLGGLLLVPPAVAQTLPDGDPAEGRKVVPMCRACHGLDGMARLGNAPHIGGESARYLAAQLMAYRDGSRQHPMMTGIARRLTDPQIADVAAWYAAHRATATLAAPAEDAPAACTACHGADGLALVDDAPHIAGESVSYLAAQLKAYRSGKRVHAAMSDIAATLTDEDIRALADWYGAVVHTIEPPAN